MVIAKGLTPGETVVTAGQLKLTQGAAVTLSADKTLQAEPTSQPGAD